MHGAKQVIWYITTAMWHKEFRLTKTKGGLSNLKLNETSNTQTRLLNAWLINFTWSYVTDNSLRMGETLIYTKKKKKIIAGR